MYNIMSENNKEYSDEFILNCRKPAGELGIDVIESMNKSHTDLSLWGLSHLDIKEDDVILDVGCGGGVNIERFTDKTNGKVYGIDYSEVSVAESTKYNQEKIDEGQVEILSGSVSDLPFDDETFNIVSGFETIYFWPDLVNDLREIHRVLKKDGVIFICNEDKKDENLMDRMGDIVNLLDMTVLSEKELHDLLEEAGFTDIEVYTSNDTNYICAIGRKK